GDRKAMLTPLTGGDWVLRQYTDNADTWATVTPVVLPGSDEGKFAKAEKLFFKALDHAGYSSDALASCEPTGDRSDRQDIQPTPNRSEEYLWAPTGAACVDVG